MRSLCRGLAPYWLALLFAAHSLALLAVLHGRLPDIMPLVWNSAGEVLYGMKRPLGAALLPCLHLAIVLFLVVAPAVDPGALRSTSAPRFYPTAVAMISAFLMYSTAVLFAAALGVPFSVPHSLLGGVGVLLVLVGNYMGKVPRNYMVGIRTPWTLASDFVWERTHRFAAPLFVTGGMGLLLHSMVQRDSPSTAFVVAILTIMFGAPFCHSYLVWRRSAPDTVRDTAAP